MMKYYRIILIFICLIFLLNYDASAARKKAIEKNALTARSAVVIVAETAKILFSKDSDKRLPPASTIKVMNAIIALETLQLDDTVIASQYSTETEGSKMGLKAGNIYTAKALIYGILLDSANDASIAIAEKIAGSETEYAKLMTDKARTIGAKHTLFLNSNGLPETGQYSTAYDLSLILRYAMKNPIFAKIIKTKKITFKDEEEDNIYLKNHNKLLWSYAGTLGGKTGYTRESRHTYVGEFAENGKKIIVAMLGSERIWVDVQYLIEKGFNELGIKPNNTKPKKAKK